MDEPAHKRYGFGTLQIDRMIVIYDYELEEYEQNKKGLQKLRASVISYARYTNKRMKTRIINGALYIKRVK